MSEYKRCKRCGLSADDVLRPENLLAFGGVLDEEKRIT